VVFSHEVVHSLGLPDLYAFTLPDTHAYVGNWDYMGNIYFRPTDLFAWQRTQLKWFDARQTLCARQRPAARSLG
jgi:M6 family metalloprotease-like protein